MFLANKKSLRCWKLQRLLVNSINEKCDDSRRSTVDYFMFKMHIGKRMG